MYNFFPLETQTFFESQLCDRILAVNELCFIKNYNMLIFQHFKNFWHKGLGRFFYALSFIPAPVGDAADI